MSEVSLHIRHCLLFLFDSNVVAGEAHRRLQEIYGEDAPSRKTCYRWWQRFEEGDRSLEDKDRSGRPTEIDRNEFFGLIIDEPRLTSREAAARMQCSQTSVITMAKEMGFRSMLGQLVPHQLTPDQRQQRVAICSSHLIHYAINNYLRQIVTGDEKWVLYVNHTRRRQWVPPR